MIYTIISVILFALAAAFFFTCVFIAFGNPSVPAYKFSPMNNSMLVNLLLAVLFAAMAVLGVWSML